MYFFISRRIQWCILLLFVGVAGRGVGCGQESKTSRHTFEVSGQQFLFDGHPYQIISGEMHYPRVPRGMWRDRFRKAKAMGLNTITTYVFWNLHEPQPGVYDFSGQDDVAEYVREAQQEGLHVILRPGPYVCAEWELGGYPSWLLKDRSLKLRSDDPKYTAAVHTWFMRLGKEIQPLLLKNGGPIIAVQLENEYGSFGDDRTYLEGLKKTLMESGMGDTVIYTANPVNDLMKGSLPELPTVINFGTGDAEKSFTKLEQLRPDGPRMSGEYWAGWFDHWGDKHHVTDGDKEAAELKWMLRQGYSVSMYMFEGGTSFGWMNGANSNGKNYEPDTTSYDYDAPLTEAGDPRAKYFEFRKVIEDVTKAKLPPVPRREERVAFPIKSGIKSASLWRNLPTPVNSKTVLAFEDLGQSYGYVLYRTGLDEGAGGMLVMNGLHDYAQVYVDQKLVGIVDRRTGVDRLEIARQTHAATLDILVENMGRVNFTKAILTEQAGLTGEVTLEGKAPKNWEIYPLPMENVTAMRFEDAPCSGPCFFQVEMSVKEPSDTFLDTRGLHKGEMWVGQHMLGRFWSVGPQYALYTPAEWLSKGNNVVTIFDGLSDGSAVVKTSTEPIFGATMLGRD